MKTENPQISIIIANVGKARQGNKNKKITLFPNLNILYNLYYIFLQVSL